MAILRGYGPGRTVELALDAWQLGIHLIEVPLQSAEDLQSLRDVAVAAARVGRIAGAGTVTRLEQIAAARQAGAAFVVSPGLDEDVIQACAEQGLPTLPGIASATEIQVAARLGLRWVKAFPAKALGTSWFHAMRGPFPEISLVATGGIDASSAGEFLTAGARAVAVGSALADPRQIEQLTDLVHSRHSKARPATGGAPFGGEP